MMPINNKKKTATKERVSPLSALTRSIRKFDCPKLRVKYGATLSSNRMDAMSTTDGDVPNNFVKYELDFYFSTTGEQIAVASGTPPIVEKFTARQLNIALETLPGVSTDGSDAKLPILTSGTLAARPLFGVSDTSGFDYNPNILCGRLATPIGVVQGSEISALYDNTVFNLEPNVDQNFVQVMHSTFHGHPDAMPPASAATGDGRVTNLFVLALETPIGGPWGLETGGPQAVAFRYTLRYMVPVLLKAGISSLAGPVGGTLEDGFLQPVLSLRTTIDAANNATFQPVMVFPDVKGVKKQ